MNAPATVEDWLGDASVTVRNVGGRPSTTRTNRQVKVLCGSCGFTAWTTRASLERGRPECCGAPLELPRLEDRAAVEWDTLHEELSRLGQRAYNDAMRELGATDCVVPLRSRERKGGAGTRTCEASGCHKFSSGRFCPEHKHERPEMGRAFR